MAAQGGLVSVIYNGDNGEYGEVKVRITYAFEVTKMVYTVDQGCVGIGYKMRDNEPKLYKGVIRQHLLTPPNI